MFNFNKVNSLGKEMGIENPVVERLGYWLDKVGPEKFGAFLEWKFYKFIEPSIIVANQDKSILKGVWFDYVDGVFCWFYLSSDPEIKFSFFNIPELMEKGIQEIINFANRPEVQKVVIDTHQFSTDQIWITEKIQVKLNAKSLFKFNQLAKELLIGEDSIIELRKKFIERKKKDYSLAVASKAKAGPTFKSLDQIFHNPDFCYGILMNTEPPVISEDFRYLLGEKKKFKVTAWYQVLHERGWVKSPPSQKDLINLLNEKMPGLDLGKDGRSLRGKDKAYGFEDFLKEMKVKIQLFKLH